MSKKYDKLEVLMKVGTIQVIALRDISNRLGFGIETGRNKTATGMYYLVFLDRNNESHTKSLKTLDFILASSLWIGHYSQLLTSSSDVGVMSAQLESMGVRQDGRAVRGFSGVVKSTRRKKPARSSD